MESVLIRIYSHDNLLIVHNLKNILEHSGVECELRNDFVTSASGEVPPIEAWPEIWVASCDETQARTIIEQAQKPAPGAVSWMCPNCAEDNGPAFEICWKCGEAHP